MGIQLSTSIRIAKKLRSIAKHTKLGYDQLAWLAGVPKPSMQNYVTGIRPCNVDIVARFLYMFPEDIEALAVWLFNPSDTAGDPPINKGGFRKVEFSRRDVGKVVRNSPEFTAYDVPGFAERLYCGLSGEFTDNWLAKRFGVTNKTATKWRNGEAPVPLEFIEFVAGLTRVSVSAFIVETCRLYIDQQKKEMT